MIEKKKVLILTYDAGFGHRSAANAVAEAVKASYGELCEVTVRNPMDDRKAPAILRDVQSDYDSFVRKVPEFYKLNYQLSDAALPMGVIDSALTVVLYGVIRSIINEVCPDVVVCTHPFYMAPLNSYITLTKRSIPYITVITDMTNVHKVWFNQGADYTLCPTEESYQEALSSGLSPETCVVTGIPINPAFSAETRPKSEIRAELGWAPDFTTALVMGSARVKNLRPILNIINHSGLPLQMVLVAGGDARLYDEFRQTEWHTLTHIYNYVDTIPTFMRASDLVIGKAGGLSVTESLACGLPLFLIDVTPGQEQGNANYVLKNNAGERVEAPIPALETLCHWLRRDHALLNQLSANAMALGRPRSAFQAAEIAWNAAQHGRLVPTSRLLSWIPRIRELLRTFNIPDTPES
jgi:1,2-diacylglycerol 3-beta-galactosyltransferase